MMLLHPLALVVVLLTTLLSAKAFVPQTNVAAVRSGCTFVAATRSDLIGAAAAIVSAIALTASPQPNVHAIEHVVAHAPASAIYNDGSTRSSLVSSSSNMMLSGLLDDYEGVFEEEGSSSTDAPADVATDQEYADQLKQKEKTEKEQAALDKEAKNKAKAAAEQQRVEERALRLARERENQRLAVESANKAAELKKQN